MPLKEINISYLYLDLKMCERCLHTDDTLQEAMTALTPVLEALGYRMLLNKVHISTPQLAEQYRFLSSPTILVNGIDILGADITENHCCNCGDICGSDVNCRTFYHEGSYYDSPPKAMIIDGVLRTIYGKVSSPKRSYTLPDNLNRFFESLSDYHTTKKEGITMKTMKIFEPAMCCSTGLCGVSVDPELLRISTVFDTLTKKGASVQRFNLSSTPAEFVSDTTINAYINEKGVDGLPVVIVDGTIVLEGRYPTNEEFLTLLELPSDTLRATDTQSGCGCDGGCCESGCC